MKDTQVNQSFSSNTDQLQYKIILVGDSCVGKSSLFLKFVLGKQFDMERLSKITMIDFKLKQITLPNEIQPIKLFIWDTAGQQKYRSIVSTYFKGCHGILLVFDLNEPQSFQNLKNDWLPIVRKKAQLALILLVGNKSDLQVKVDRKQVEKFAKENKLIYIETSVKMNHNVNETFINLTTMINAKKHQMERPQSFYLKQKQHKSKKNRNCCLFH